MTQTADQIKNVVREKYGQIALQSKQSNQNSCCGVGTPGTYTIMSDSYDHLEGYHQEADLGLGCGLPTQFAHIQSGDVVLDLGSGAGNDAFVARSETGAEGKVIGIDFTPAMIQRARENAEKLRYHNVEFRQGDIEDLPVSDNSVDVVVSNCVLNLVPDKAKVFSEIMRVLRPGGHFSISDVVLEGELPDALRNAAEMYAGCVSGAMQKSDYMNIIEAGGFEEVSIQKQKPVLVPDHILLEYLTEEALNAFIQSKTGIFSITVFGRKPGGKKESVAKPKVSLSHAIKSSGKDCCSPGSGCC